MGWAEDRVDDAADLVDRIRAGDENALGEFWMGHHGLLTRYVSRRAPELDAEDVASTVLEATGSALRSGHGPTHAVRGYLYSAARTEIGRRRTRADRERLLLTQQDAVARHLADNGAPAPTFEGRHLLHDVIASLPPADARLLTALQVENHDIAQVAKHVGLLPAQVSRRIYKLRTQVQQRWMQAHVDAAGLQGGHAAVLAHAGQVLAGRASTSVRRAFEDHLAGCDQCAARVAEARSDSRTLAALLPALFPAVTLLDGAAGASASAVGSSAATAGTGGLSGGAVAGGGSAGGATAGASAAGSAGTWILAAAVAAAVVVGGGIAAGSWISARGTVAETVERSPAAPSDRSVTGIERTAAPHDTGDARHSAHVSATATDADPTTLAPDTAAGSIPGSVAVAPATLPTSLTPVATTTPASAPGTAAPPSTMHTSPPSSATALVPCAWSTKVRCYAH